MRFIYSVFSYYLPNILVNKAQNAIIFMSLPHIKNRCGAPTLLALGHGIRRTGLQRWQL